MKARAGLSLVIGILVLGVFSACQEASKHKSQGIQSSQVSASSAIPSQYPLSDNRKSSASKTAQSSQAQLQQPHSDSSISASKANTDSAISTSSSPDTNLSPKPKAITKKQAKDFCHSDWVKQHYPCNEGKFCHYTQEQVYDDINDPYQCKILSPEQNLAVILKLVNNIYNDGTYEETYYTVTIDLIDTKTPRVLDHFKGEESYMDDSVFNGVYAKTLSSSRDLAKANELFGVIFNLHRPQRHNDSGDILMDGATINLYRYTNNKLRQVLHDLKLGEKSQYEDDDMERKLSKNTKKNCINIIESEKTGYHFVNTTNKELPDLILNKTIDQKWIQGVHYDLNKYIPSLFMTSICDSDYPTKVIKRSKALKKTTRLKFSNGKYNVPEDWRSGFLDKIGVY